MVNQLLIGVAERPGKEGVAGDMESDLEVKGNLDYLVSWFSCCSVWPCGEGTPRPIQY